MARKRKEHRKHFPSLRAAIQWVDSTPRTWPYKSSQADGRQYSWDLNAGYEGALKLARDGWQEGAQSMANALVRLPAIDTVPELSHAVAGFLPDVGRYCTGMPDCMWNLDEQQGSKPVLSLAVEVSANCNIDAQAMSNYGLAIARYVDEMESAGMRVEVIAAICANENGERLVYSWTVKDAGDAMNLADMAFSIGHPACFRRIGFAMIERSDAKPCSSYGYAEAIKASDFDVPVICLRGIASANSHSRTPESALENLREVLDAAIAESLAPTE